MQIGLGWASTILAAILASCAIFAMGMLAGRSSAMRQCRKHAAVELVGERRIADMEPGEIGWTVPWAMSIRRGRPFIRGDYTAHGRPAGTASMRIERTPGGVEILSVPEGTEFGRSNNEWEDDLPVRNGTYAGPRPPAAAGKPAMPEDDLS